MTKNDWIPVAERLPEAGRKVMIIVPQPDGETYMAYLGTREFDSGDLFYAIEVGYLGTGDVIAWAPIVGLDGKEIA